MDFIRFLFPDFSLEAFLASTTKAFQDLDISWMDTAKVWLFWVSLPLLTLGVIYLVCRIVAAVANRKSSDGSRFMQWVYRFSLPALVVICLGAISLASSYIAEYTYNPRTVVVQAE